MTKNNTPTTSKLSFWIMAIRPKTLLASQGPVLLGLFLAFDYNQNINLAVAALTLLCALLMQIGTNLVNDYFDHFTGVDSESRLGPERVTSNGLLTPQDVKAGYFICFITSFLLGCFLMTVGGYPIIIIGLLFQKFYQTYIQRVFNTKTRIFKYKAVLPLKFLLTYSLADKVFISGRAFTINKITTDLQTGRSTLELLNEPS